MLFFLIIIKIIIDIAKDLGDRTNFNYYSMKKVLLLLAQGFEVYEASVFIDVIGWNFVDGQKNTKLFTCALTKEITSAFDQKFVVDCTLNEINVGDYDALAIPGGFEEYHFYEDAFNPEFLEAIKRFHSKNKIIASICVGSIVLGKSGILKGLKATTYNMNPIRKKKLKSFGVRLVNEPIVIEGNVITSWNPSTAIDVALKLLEWLTDKENADHIRKIMGFS